MYIFAGWAGAGTEALCTSGALLYEPGLSATGGGAPGRYLHEGCTQHQSTFMQAVASVGAAGEDGDVLPQVSSSPACCQNASLYFHQALAFGEELQAAPLGAHLLSQADEVRHPLFALPLVHYSHCTG